MIENQDIQQVDGKTPQFRTELARQLEDLVPEAIADGKVDVAKLKELLQEDAGDTNERFGLFWPGKKRAMRAAQDPTTATLKPAKELSKDWDTTQNIFIEGDNLEVLKVLQKQYHNAIKMIYIDPPYNTGKDFVYPDNFKEGLQNYLEFSKQVDEGNKKISTNTETAGRYHSNWLNMMYPRLKLARNLLTDDGVIFISIDDNEQDNLKKVCNEIYGESNFLANIAVVNNLKGRSDDEFFATSNEYLLCYARSAASVKLDGFALPKSMKEEYKLSDSISRYKDVSLQKTGKNSRRIDRPNMYYEIFYNPETENFSLEQEGGALGIYPTPINSVDGRWRWGRDTFLKNKDTELTARKIGENWRIYVKMRDIVDGQERKLKPKTTWIDPKYDTGNGGRAVKQLFNAVNYFDNPKAPLFIQDILTVAANTNSVILDFFAGSATTAHAVMLLNAEDGGNRKHIQVQLPEPTDEKSEAYKAGYRKISDIARERINRAGEKIKTDFADKLKERKIPLDVGYRTYKLSDTNFTKWQGSATADLGEVQRRLDLMRDSANDNASEAELMVEVMLKMGLPLTTRTTEQSVSGLTIHQVVHATNDDDTDTSEGAPVFYLNEHAKPTLEQLRAVVTELTPSKLVILEDAFQGDNELKTNLTQTCKSYDVELWTV